LHGILNKYFLIVFSFVQFIIFLCAKSSFVL
jgi:hypothetical protein